MGKKQSSEQKVWQKQAAQEMFEHTEEQKHMGGTADL